MGVDRTGENVVLHGGETVRQHAHVMIVNQCQRADYQAIRLLGGFSINFANEVAKGFGTIGIARC